MSPEPRQNLSHAEQTLGRRWVIGIVLGLSAVVVVNLFVAYIAGSSHAELERDDYYLASLSYQDSVDAQRRAAALGYALDYGQRGLQLTHGAAAVTAPIAGTLHMLRPDHAASDFSRTITFPLDTTEQTHMADLLHPGRWQAAFTLYGVDPTVTVTAKLYVEASP